MSDLQEGALDRVMFGIYLSGVQLIIFCLLAYFNYLWRINFVSARLSKAASVLVIIVVNILIFLGLNFLESSILNTWIDIGRRIPVDYLLFANFSVAAVAIAEAYFIILFQKVRASELENTKLREEKTNAELAALKEQISPHFFFNTLSSLSTVVRNEEKELGLEFIQEISNTYRYTLASRQQDLVNLEAELDFVRSYIFVIQKRFGDKLIFDLEVSGNDFRSKIPPMSLQQLIENAI
ncbi:MAG: histidine kinase [Bacteroidales bacterium]|nr:histidine kinase [Bacteroidales bacterium]